VTNGDLGETGNLAKPAEVAKIQITASFAKTTATTVNAPVEISTEEEIQSLL
jgi:hypothetical protein